MVDPLGTFLRLIFPWDQQYQTFYKSVMWRFIPTPGQEQKGPPLANFAAQSYDDLVRLINGRKDKPQADMWICLGMQRGAVVDKTSRDGFPKANRTKPNIASLKSIWLDIDVKDTGYPDVPSAVAGLFDFIKKSGMPRPTMIVRTGSTGGMHVYWVLDEPITTDVWQQLANNLRDVAHSCGLRFDPQVTVNAAGVLRIPTTRNWKREPVVFAELIVPDDEHFPVYTYTELAAVLQVQAAAVAGMHMQPSTVKTGTNQALMANVANTSAPTPPLTDIASECPLVASTLARGGAGDQEPLWNLMVLMATFTDDPRADAHRLSKDDPRYTPAETDRKFDEKEAAKAANPGIGWPLCKSFANEIQGRPVCTACPHLQAGRSPLNFARRPKANQQPGQAVLVPSPYWQDPNEHVYITTTDENGSQHAIDIFGYPILDAGLDAKHERLAIKTKIAGHDLWGSISNTCYNQPAALLKEYGSLGNGGFPIQQAGMKRVREFTVSWIQHLQSTKRNINPMSFGWANATTSFCFGDAVFTPTGIEPAYLGKTRDTRYRAEGKLKPWQDAMALVYGNIPLETVVASAFAAPLINLFTDDSAIMSICSASSGVGKSTALKLAQAVWGDPRTGISSLDDTANSVKQKVNDLKSLPIYWDELITVEAVDKVVNLVFSFTQGKGKARLTAGSQQMETNAYTTLFCIASNHGISNKVYSGTSGTEAGGLRVFEIDVPPAKTQMSLGQAGKLKLDLNTNFGMAGAIFADMIVKNRKAVIDMIDLVSQRFDQKFKFSAKERFWRVTMIAVMAGAITANFYGLTSFDLEKIAAFLGRSFEAQRVRLSSKDEDTLSTSDSVNALLAQMITENSNNVLTTNIVPPPNIMGPAIGIRIESVNPHMLYNVWIQVGKDDHRIRIQQRSFQMWLAKRGHNYDHVMSLLTREYHVAIRKMSIGSGTFVTVASNVGKLRSTCIDLTPITSSGSSHGSP